MRAAERISSETGRYRSDESLLELALLIDRETGVSKLRDALEKMTRFAERFSGKTAFERNKKAARKAIASAKALNAN